MRHLEECPVCGAGLVAGDNFEWCLECDHKRLRGADNG